VAERRQGALLRAFTNININININII